MASRSGPPYPARRAPRSARSRRPEESRPRRERERPRTPAEMRRDGAVREGVTCPWDADPADGVTSGAPRTDPSAPSLSQVRGDLAGGVLSILASDATARVRAGAGQVETVESESISSVTEQWAPEEVLIESMLAVHRVTAAEPVVAFEVQRRQDLSS